MVVPAALAVVAFPQPAGAQGPSLPANRCDHVAVVAVEVDGHRSNRLDLSTRPDGTPPETAPPQLRAVDEAIGVRRRASSGYDIRNRVAGSSSWSVWRGQEYVNEAGDGIWTYIRGLRIGITYEVRVRPQAHVANTGWSTPRTATPESPESTAEPTLTVRRGNTVIIEDSNCGANTGCRWVLGSGSAWPLGEQYWIRCGSGVDTSQNRPVTSSDRFVDSNGNLSWGPGICASAVSHTVEVWTQSGTRQQATVD